MNVPRTRPYFLAILVVAGSLGFASSAGASVSASPWSTVRDPHFGSLKALSALSPSDIWAVGYFYDQPQGRYLPLTEHWDGAAFSYIHAPTASRGYNAFNGVVATSANDVWAVGYQTPVYYTDDHSPLIEHWDGSSWRVVRSAYSRGADLNAVAGTSPSDVWAVGTRSSGGSLVQHWDGSRWSLVDDGHSDDLTALQAVMAVGPDDVWIGGSTTGNRAFVEHWDGSIWTEAVTSEDVEYTDFNSISIDGSGDLWGVGWQSPGFGSFTFASRYDGSNWTTTDTPDLPWNNTFYGVVMVGARGWAVGYGSPTGPAPLIERWSGGRWRPEPNPGPGGTILYAVAQVGGTLWTVGDNLIMRRDL